MNVERFGVSSAVLHHDFAVYEGRTEEETQFVFTCEELMRD